MAAATARCRALPAAQQWSCPPAALRPGRRGGAAAQQQQRRRPQRGGGALQVSAYQVAPSPSKTKWWEAEAPPNVIHIHSASELLAQLEAGADRLVVVDFFTPWCASCRAIFPKLLKMMAANPEVTLLCCNFEENKVLVKSLGVKVLPWFMLFRGAEGKVAQFTASITKIQLLKDAVEQHSPARCSVGATPVPFGLAGTLSSAAPSGSDGAAPPA